MPLPAHPALQGCPCERTPVSVDVRQTRDQLLAASLSRADQVVLGQPSVMFDMCYCHAYNSCMTE